MDSIGPKSIEKSWELKGHVTWSYLVCLGCGIAAACPSIRACARLEMEQSADKPVHDSWLSRFVARILRRSVDWIGLLWYVSLKLVTTVFIHQYEHVYRVETAWSFCNVLHTIGTCTRPLCSTRNLLDRISGIFWYALIQCGIFSVSFAGSFRGDWAISSPAIGWERPLRRISHTCPDNGCVNFSISL